MTTGVRARILADSVSPGGERLTTMELTYQRFIHAELMTHRVFSRNSASSRAIPTHKLLERVETDPAMPVHWGSNQPGMQAGDELDGADRELAKEEWLVARDSAVQSARRLLELGLHKQVVNRILEPWLWHTVIVSATEWSNFFALRDHPDAQPEIAILARAMRFVYDGSEPTQLDYDQWHLPLIFNEDREAAKAFDDPLALIKVCIGRCARVSYLTHDGKRDLQADIELHDRLVSSGHMSPCEHAAKPLPGFKLGNFVGWEQYRKTIAYEHDFGLVQKSATGT